MEGQGRVRQRRQGFEGRCDYAEAIRLDPRSAIPLNNRGWARVESKQYDKAIADLDQALKLDPKYLLATTNRGAALYGKKRYAEASAAQAAALVLNPRSEYVLRRLAWMFACCSDAKFRDGNKALEYGKKLVEINQAEWSSHQALAAAHAEAGDFEMAVAEQRKALDMAKGEKNLDADALKKAEARLELHRAKKPYRDEE